MSESPDPALPPPEVLLLVAPGCPHCATVLEGLSTLVKEAAIGRMEVVNIAVQPEAAREYGVRAVPWMRLGPFELAGMHSPEELRRWSELARSRDGMTVYLSDLLSTGRRAQVLGLVRRNPALVARLAELLGDGESELGVRVGIMATLEELQEDGLLAEHAALFTPLIEHANATVRADGCHALTLIGTPESIEILRRCSEDPDAMVRETALDGLELLTREAP